MRILLISSFLAIVQHLSAQQDYFYAEDLCKQGKYAEAVQVLDHLSANGAYADRPRFAMMTLNLAGSTKLLLKDTVGAAQAFTSAMACYDSLTLPRKEDDWNRRERYIAGEKLARIYCAKNEFSRANDLLKQIRYPGRYYSSTGSDVIAAQDNYCRLRADVFQNLNEPDSAFQYIRKMRDPENHPVRRLDSLFDVSSNYIYHVRCVVYTMAGSAKKRSFLFFVAYKDSSGIQNSIWFVNPESGPIEIIGTSTYNAVNDRNFPANCYNMSLSPDEHYLAIECYTEGSNHIEIMSFPEIITTHYCILKKEIEAYPASVDVVGWEKTQLVLESEADLTKLNKLPRLSFPDYPGDTSVKSQFLFDPESGKYSRK